MMHARALVRRLLSLRKRSELQLNRSTEIGPNFATDAQAGADRKLRHAVVQSNLRNGLGCNGQHMQGVSDFEGVRPELNRSFRGRLSHCIPLDELNQNFAGQLSGKSSRGRE